MWVGSENVPSGHKIHSHVYKGKIIHILSIPGIFFLYTKGKQLVQMITMKQRLNK